MNARKTPRRLRRFVRLATCRAVAFESRLMPLALLRGGSLRGDLRGSRIIGSPWSRGTRRNSPCAVPVERPMPPHMGEARGGGPPRHSGPPVKFVKRDQNHRDDPERVGTGRQSGRGRRADHADTTGETWVKRRPGEGPRLLPYVSEVRGIMASMIENNYGPNGGELARWRTWAQAGFLLVWLNPLLLHIPRVLRAGVPLLFLPLGRRSPARSASWPITARCTSCRCWPSGRCWRSARRLEP